MCTIFDMLVNTLTRNQSATSKAFGQCYEVLQEDNNNNNIDSNDDNYYAGHDGKPHTYDITAAKLLKGTGVSLPRDS